MSEPTFGQWPPQQQSSGDVITWTEEIATPGTHDVQTGEHVVNLYQGQPAESDPIVLRFPAAPVNGTIVNTKESTNAAGAVTFLTQGSIQIEDITGGFNVPSFGLQSTDVNVSIQWAYDAAGNAWRMLRFYRPEGSPP